MIDREIKLHNEQDNVEYIEILREKLNDLVFSDIKDTLIRKIEMI